MDRKLHPLFHALWDLDARETSIALELHSYHRYVTLDYPSSAPGGPAVSLPPIFFAVTRMYGLGINDTQVVELLMAYGFSVIGQFDVATRTTVLHCVCRLEKHWQIRWRDRTSPFKALCQLSCGDTAMQHEGGVNFHDDDWNTPLHCAVKNAMPPSGLEVLLSLGADPNKKNASGLTPLHLAISGYRVDIVRFLCMHGADTALRLPNGTDCLTLAREYLVAESSKTDGNPQLRAHSVSCRQAILDCLVELQPKEQK